MSEKNKYYSLSQVLKSVSSVIANAYKSPYWIKADMIKLNYYPKSGHCYPDLVEKSEGKIKAQMRATMWSGNYEKANAKFVNTTGKELSDGMNILFLAQVKFDAVYGFSLNILDIDADYELGILAKAKKECIIKLKDKGVFYNNKKLKLPQLPQRIAIISDETSKGYHDFISIVDNNSRGYKFFYMLFPSLLQGDAAVRTMLNQLSVIKKLIHHFDLVAIIRGGGGDVGMDCYNNYELASEVANFPIPVISGIGHSTNETVVEMVAHLNPITPTDLAYLLQQKFDNNAVAIDDYQSVIENYTSDYLNEKINIVNGFASVVINKSKELFNEQNNILQQHKQTAVFASKTIISLNKNRIHKFSSESRLTMQKRLSVEEFRIANSTKSLYSISKNLIINQKQKIGFIEDKIELVKPDNILKRGYSYNTVNGKIVTDIDDLNVGDKLITVNYEGNIESKITKIKKNNKA